MSRYRSRLFGSDDLHQLSVAYPNSPLTEDGFGILSGIGRSGVRAGDRAPEAPVIGHDGETVSLFSLIYGGDYGEAPAPSWGWTLLAFDGRDPEARTVLHSAMEAAAPFDFIRARTILADPAATSGEKGTRHSLSDLDGVAHKAYGLEGTPALVLIRPDGHIALRVPADAADRLIEYCERTFAPRA